MAKRMIIMLVVVGLLLGGIFGWVIFRNYEIGKYMAHMKRPPATVTATKAELKTWQPRLSAVGSVRAVHGVDVTAEIAGLVRSVDFKSGDDAKAGQLLVQLNDDADVAQLHAMQAAADLALTTYKRDRSQYAVKAISKATLDAAAADLKGKKAQAEAQAAIVAKKAIRAPFAGRLGITTVNPGQYINPGQKIVSLQSLDPVYVDFSVPQQRLSRIAVGQTVNVTTDSYPGQTFSGTVTALDPHVDAQTRNIQLEATIANPKNELLPGMYATIKVQAGKPQRYLTVPQTSVAYNPYGDTVFVVEQAGKDKKGNPLLVAKQAFVTVGDTRGDQVAILKGVKEGDQVVTSGQLKLRNGSPIVINNKVQPSDNPDPKPVDE